jgi:hypothetical protein
MQVLISVLLIWCCCNIPVTCPAVINPEGPVATLLYTPQAIIEDAEPVEHWYNKASSVEGGNNCMVMPVYIRGWPHLFMVITQPIAKGQHLYFEYGGG